ncbi:DUF885 domain-containing protein [Sphingomonas ginsenosidivorax]|uniref:DUF885 domain-containing protein n=1 Tax=Sphingomonas ginsenosidivorax TaxID=862135 RepID=A0A5C6UCN5_9SPHN|nr:DUF885 domain-containing protein [Sphingomonas ginsenosidivorax]TXC70160.1 DUF885 domain-containing protein [Sphingomonas ginsenosidivorax]
MTELTKRAFLGALMASVAMPVLGQGPAAGTDDAALLRFLDAAFDAQVALSPEFQTNLGLKTNNDRLDDYTDAAAQRRQALEESQLAEMKRRFSPARLGAGARLSYRLFEDQIATDRRQFAFRDYAFPVSTNGSPAGDIPVFLINEHRVDTVADARAYVARLRDSLRVMRETAARMRAQAAKGIVPPQMVFAPARSDARQVITGAPFDTGPDSTLFADFKEKLAKLTAPAAVKATLLADAIAALKGPFRQGFDVLFATLDAIEPQAKGNDGAWSLPNGAAYYQARLAYYTTTDLTADQIHQLGLDQVKAIHAEMTAVMTRAGIKGSLAELFARLRNDPAFKYPNTDAGRQQYLADARAAIAQTMAAAPRFFRRLPKAPLEVRAVEAWRQETASVAFYNQPAPDGSRPGIFYVNLADMNQVQKPQVEGIAHHEGAPGHHFQIARSQELTDVPKFRRFGYYGAYTEGWGLYSERLAKEMGAYTDPYSELGMLSLQVWRACRLVLDTGMHAKRWSRDQAIAYFTANAPLSQRDVTKEVDRYINNPGQATSYMVGQLRIAALRKKAETALGAKFDLPDFHEVVLASGALPLGVLEEQVDAWIAGVRRG